MRKTKDRKSIALFIAVAIAIGVGFGAGTYAFFTSVANTANNTITAGKLETTIDDEAIAIGTGGNNIALNNVAPGTTINYLFKVTNGTSTIDQKYKITLVNGNSAASNDLTAAAVFDLSITNGGNTATQTNLSYADFVTALATTKNLVHTSERNEDEYSITIKIPTSLGNNYQEAQGSFQLRVDSTQTENTTF